VSLLQPGVLDTSMLKMHLEELLSFTEEFLVAILLPDVFHHTDNLLGNYFRYAGQVIF